MVAPRPLETPQRRREIAPLQQQPAVGVQGVGDDLGLRVLAARASGHQARHRVHRIRHAASAAGRRPPPAERRPTAAESLAGLLLGQLFRGRRLGGCGRRRFAGLRFGLASLLARLLRGVCLAFRLGAAASVAGGAESGAAGRALREVARLRPGLGWRRRRRLLRLGQPLGQPILGFGVDLPSSMPAACCCGGTAGIRRPIGAAARRIRCPWLWGSHVRAPARGSSWPRLR